MMVSIVFRSFLVFWGSLLPVVFVQKVISMPMSQVYSLFALLVSGLTLKSLTHLKLSFAQNNRYRFIFILLYEAFKFD